MVLWVRLAFRLVYLAMAAWLVGCAAMFAVMLLPPGKMSAVAGRVPGWVMMRALPFRTLWTVARAGGLKVGEEAPGFDLPYHDGSGRVSLASHRGERPVVLVFGSYT
jgi:hypothetical protein